MKFAFIISFSLFSWETYWNSDSWNKGHKHPEYILQCDTYELMWFINSWTGQSCCL